MSVNINNVYSVYFEGYIPLLLLDFLFWCFYFFFIIILSILLFFVDWV